MLMTVMTKYTMTYRAMQVHTHIHNTYTHTYTHTQHIHTYIHTYTTHAYIRTYVHMLTQTYLYVNDPEVLLEPVADKY